MDNLLVNQMGQHLNRRLAEQFVVAAVRFLELVNHAIYHKSDHIRQLSIDCGQERRIDMRKRWTSHLSFENGPS